MAISRRGVLRGAAALSAGALAGPLVAPRLATAAPSGPDMRPVYERIKTPYKYGLIVPPPGNGHYDSPSVYRHNGRWYMTMAFFDAGRQGYETRIAVSDNLLNWSVYGTILPFRDGWDRAQAAGYIALQDTTFGGGNSLRTHNGQYWMSYIGGSTFGYEEGELSIGMASTADPTSGGAWGRRAAPVLRPTDSNSRWFEKSKLYKSNIIYDADRRLGASYIMYYNATGDSQAGNSGSEHIGMALSNDMISWRRYGADPVVRANGSYANRVVGDPQVIKVGGMWVMSFWARDSAKRGTGVYNTFAGSWDLVNWTKWEGEKLLCTTVGYERDAAHKPWIIHHDGVTYQFYSAVGDNGFGIGVATSRDLRAPAGATVAGASYTFIDDSAGEAVDGTISHSSDPENRWTAWDSPNRHDWLMVEYPSNRDVSSVRLEIYNDNDGVRPPKSYHVEYWTGSGWTGVPNLSKSPGGPAAGANTATFTTVNTSKIRVWFEHADSGAGIFSGVTEMVVNGAGGGGNLLANANFEQGQTSGRVTRARTPTPATPRAVGAAATG